MVAGSRLSYNFLQDRQALVFVGVTLVLLATFTPCVFGQITPHGKAVEGQVVHGTVNVVLANQHGLVAATDSRLSNNGRPLGRGKKLFQIDDHTICTIAGWFGVPGPIADAATTPLSTSIPAFFSSFIASTSQELPKMTMNEKLESLTQVLVSSLEFVGEIGLKSHSIVGTSESQLIFAEENLGVIQIVRVDLKPTINGDHIDYDITQYPVQKVTDKLIFSTAGLDDVAFDILNGIGPQIDGDPIIDKYKRQMSIDKGASLTLEELEQTAEDVVKRTGLKYPAEVGPPLQMAVINGGSAGMILQPFDDLMPYSPPSTFSNIIFKNFPSGGIFGGKGYFIFRVGVEGDSNRSGQALDGNYFYESHFKKCSLTFDGDAGSIFDSSNTIEDCTLTVRSEDQLITPFVARFKRNFPKVQVIVNPAIFQHLGTVGFAK